MNIETIKDYMKFAGKVWPTGKEALDFIVTEVGEILNSLFPVSWKALTNGNN